ncbi:MAG: aspartate/glutamate racemase family protein [Bradymonadia bacterium]
MSSEGQPLGLIGGMSWQSTQSYYQRINTLVNTARGGLTSAHLLLWSVDMATTAERQSAGRWDEAGAYLAEGGRRLVDAGAGALMLCTNTMHKVAEPLAELGVPFLHIGDAVADAAREIGAGTLGLLGTRFTMSQRFYRDRIAARHGAEVLTPNAEDQAEVNRLIYEELCLGHFTEASRAHLTRVVSDLAEAGAEAVILGCTELGLLLPPGTAGLPPLLDSAEIHSVAGARWLLEQ